MTFLQPLFIYGLFAALIPLLIHFLSKRKKHFVPFSSLYFLKILESKRIKNIRLRQILLLITRMLILALIAIAFSRPALTGSWGGSAGDEPVAAALILDNSLSSNAESNGGTRFELLKQSTLSVLNTFSDGDEVTFMTSTSETVPEEFSDIDQLRRKINSITASTLHSDLSEMLNRALSVVENSQLLHREVYLVSDMQATAFTDSIIKIESPDPIRNIRIYLVSAEGSFSTNTGITGIELRNQIFETGKPFSIRAFIRNFSEQPVSDLLVSLYFDGQRVAQQDVGLDSGTSETVDFQVIPERYGIIEGMVEIEDDILGQDNRRYFTVRIPESIKLLLVDGNPESSIYLNSVYESGLEGPVRMTAIASEEIAAADVNAYDVVILNGFTLFTESDMLRLRNFCASGGSIMIFPSEESDTESYNTVLAESLELPRLQGTFGRLLAPESGEQEFVRVENIDLSHPVFQDLYTGEGEDPDLPRVYFMFNISTGSGSKSIITLSGGMPFLSETAVGTGKVFLFAAAPSLRWSSFPLKGMFAPVIYRSVQYLAASDGFNGKDYITGNEISFSYSGATQDLSMITPEGESFILSPEVSSGAYQLTFNNTEFPGIYRFYQGEHEHRLFAVNIDPAESDLVPADMDRLSHLLGDYDLTLLNENGAIEDRIFESRFGREIGGFFVIALIILLLIETFLQLERYLPKDETA